MRSIIYTAMLLLLGATSALAGPSRDFNPAISVNSLLLFTDGLVAESHEHGEEEDEHGASTEGFGVQETEVQFTANVDAYARANVTLAMHGTEGIEAEEAFLELLTLPRGLGLRAGAFLHEFGKQNSLHTHQRPFVEQPFAWEILLGEHGLSGAAVELSWLSPLPWYGELIATAAPLDEAVYNLHEAPEGEWATGLRLRQLWDLGDRITFDLGASWFGGDVAHEHDEEIETGTRAFLGLDGTLKWSGGGANPRQVELQGEWLRRRDALDDETLEADGFLVSARTRVSRRFWLGGRFDAHRPPSIEAEEDDEHEHEPLPDTDTWTLSLAFAPSEFQAWRLDVLRREAGGESETGLRAQVNFTIGSHPAHRY